MTEAARVDAAAANAAPAAEAAATSPGAQLRRWREAQGMHLAMLAASLKVPPRRLEALEADRWDELPDPAFTRALAQSVCRVLKRDPAPVLALLPRPDGSRLEHVAAGVNAPFRERPGAVEPGFAPLLRRPAAWVVAALLLAAAAVMFWPAPLGELPLATDARDGSAPASAPADAGAAGDPAPAIAPDSAPAPASSGPVGAGAAASAASAASAGGSESGAAAADGTAAGETVLPGDAAAPDPAAPAAATTQAAVGLRASAESWVEARDADGRVVFSRTLRAGESVELDAAPPLRLTIGNAAATELTLRGQPVDLAPHLSGNVARIELK